MTQYVAIAGAVLLIPPLPLAFIWWKRGADVGRTRFFKNQLYRFQALRGSNDIPAGGVDTGAILHAILPFALVTRKA
jgi:hypothetical protein